MTKEVYKHVFEVYGHNPWQWIGSVADVFRTVVVRVYVPIVMAQITVSLAAGDFSSAKKYLLYFFVSYVLSALVGTWGEVIIHRTENAEYGRQAMKYYQKLIGKDLSFYRDNQTGYLTTAFRQYLDGSLLFLRFLRVEILSSSISLLVPPIVLFTISPAVGLVIALVVIIQILYVMWASAKVGEYRKKTHELYRRVTGEVADEITNIVAFKSGGIEDQAHSKMARFMKEENEAYYTRRTVTALLDLPRMIITAAGVAFAIYIIIGKAAAVNPESLGLMVLTTTYLFQIVRNVALLPELVNRHDDHITKIYPTLKYLTTEHEGIRDPKNPTELVISKGVIGVEHAGFSYPSHSDKNIRIPVFQDLNIEVKGSEQIGLVGLSGAGKSTLANLLLRFDEVERGAIKIDGIDIREVRQTDLRRNIAYVPQEPLLFHRTIRENISYYNPDASEDEIIRAAKAAHAHEFIEKLPDGYNTVVGERGIKLSGGQKQRVAIARAILKKAPIMIFDEATSALDSESEQIIQRALPEILGKQTAVIVAHRLSTVAGLDRIIVMHDGKIVEEGTHEELLKLQGRYYSLWQKQTAEFGS